MQPERIPAAVIGAGPAGLMAAEQLAAAGVPVEVFDAMPSVGRKFLLAGIGGMNITHSEPLDDFIARYRDRAPEIGALLREFGPDELRAWIHGLGIETFVGSSGRVFPIEMKAAPLLRAWLHRLREAGVKIHTRHRWLGFDAGGASLIFETRAGMRTLVADTVVLALGGGSWPKLGSDGAWLPWLRERGVEVKPLLPSNGGFEVNWSGHIRERFAGAPVKPVTMTFAGARETISRRGEFIVTAHGVEGGLVYALSAPLRDEILARGFADIRLDLAPDRDARDLAGALATPRDRKSLSEHVRRRAGLHGVKAALLREGATAADLEDAVRLAARIKALPLRLERPRPLEEAISSAGGVAFESVDAGLMLRQMPGVFVAGEMLDWEAPTGGYLLTACFASGHRAGRSAGARLTEPR